LSRRWFQEESSMLRKTALLSLVALCACEPEVPPTPEIISIEPEEVVKGEAAQIAVRLDAPLSVQFDYGTRSAKLLVPPTLQIGEHEVGVEGVEEDGSLRVIVPAELAEGEKDVRVKMPNGSEAVREEGLKVLPRLPGQEKGQDGASNDSPRAGITGFRFEPIPNQVRNVPFLVTLRAEGPEAASFDSQVLLTSSKGRLSPNLSGPFSGGTRTEEFVIDHPGGDVQLVVRFGEFSVTSNSFRVMPQ
jgi:hypothetical protein